MSAVNQLGSVNLRELLAQTNPTRPEANKDKKQDFGDTISDFINSVNDQAREAAQISQDVIQGRSDNLQEAMAALEESGLSFKLMVEIRNKLLESFKEVERMSV